MVATSMQFCERHPGVEIIWEKRPLQAFADRPLEQMVDEYDLMVVDHPHAGVAAKSGLLLPLDNQGFDKQLAQLAEESCGVSHSSYEFGERQWALAIDAATPISAYREDLIGAVLTTWSEVRNLAEQGQVIWPLVPINALMSFYNLLASLGEPFGENGAGVELGTGITVLEEMRSVSRHLPDECFSMDPINAYEWLASRSDRSYVPYLYGYTNYSRRGFRSHLVKAANIPALGNQGPIGSPIGGAGIAISAKSAYRDIALEYAYWIASADCQRGVFFEAGGQPANIAAWTDETCNSVSHNFFADTLDTLKASSLRPRHDGYMAFQDIGSDLVHAFLTGQRNASATISAINIAYERSLL